MNNQPLFSVLIANYNNGIYLMEAINSIYKQDYNNWEIIIVDDASTDDSFKIYKKLENDTRIKVFYNEKNKGCGYTKRRCVDEAIGEICAFLDPDDALDNSALRKMTDAHIQNPSVSIIYSRFYFCDESLNILSESSTEQQKIKDPYFFNFEGKIPHLTSFKKEFYLKTEGIDPYLKRAVDQDLYLKLYDVGDNYFLNEVLYYYRLHNRGISTFDNVDKALFWHWVVIMNTAKRRNIDVEDLFFTQFIVKKHYFELIAKYTKLKKYEKLNTFLGNIRKKIFLKKG